MAIIQATHSKIRTFFSSSDYVIPVYQRGYSWGKDELEDLWEDIQNQLDNPNDVEHFLGQIVVHTDAVTSKKHIIDGQQRITSISILFSVIRSFYQEMKKSYDGDDGSIITNLEQDISLISSSYIGLRGRRDESRKLILGKSCDDYFYNNIQFPENGLYPLAKHTNNTEKNIKAAVNYFRSNIEGDIKSLSFEQQYDYLEILSTIVADHIQISYIETDDQTQAFVIFETLNARGASLATSDLLKNHIIRSSKEEAREGVISKWNSMVDMLEMNDPTKYIRSFWNSRHEFSRNKSLYKNLRREYDKPGEIEKLIVELEEYSSIYKSLVEPDLTAYPDMKINSQLIDLNSLSASTYYPLFLALVYRDYPSKDILEILHSITNYYVRNIIVAGNTANKTEVFFAKLALKVSTSQENFKKDILEDISKEKIDDEDFMMRFKKFTSKNTKHIRYLLTSLETEISGTEKKIDKLNIHVEHIMPKSNDIWDYDSLMHEEYVNRFGNLTLLGPEYNIDASNNLFSDKLSQYKKSTVNLTKELLESSDWGKEQIEERQKRLAEIAIRIW